MQFLFEFLYSIVTKAFGCTENGKLCVAASLDFMKLVLRIRIGLKQIFWYLMKQNGTRLI